MGPRWGVILAACLTGCLQSGSVVCGGITCPRDTECATVSATAIAAETTLCVARDQITACAGKDTLADCTATGVSTGRCYDGVCLSAGCGNARLDPGEACDDGNATIGDGCSYDCQSAETCGNDFVDPLVLDADGKPQPREACDDGNALGADGCTSQCSNETPAWTPILTGPPTPMQSVAMTYDASRDRVVAFGGGGNYQAFFSNMTWEWDGAMWRIANPIVRPSSRIGAALAYDAARHQVVLFGGTTGAGGQADTWVWDGRTWKNLPVTGPRARGGHAMAYDPRRKTIVLYGGEGTQSGIVEDLLDDTWEWDGHSWKQLQSVGSAGARRGHALAFDPVRNELVLAGGEPGDTWALTSSGWVNKPSANTPPELIVARMAWDSQSKRMIAYGGAAPVAKTFAWDGVAWSDLSQADPKARAEVGIASMPSRGEVVMYGGGQPVTGIVCGSCDYTYGDIWAWSGSAWTDVTPTSPVPAPLHSSAVATDPVHQRVVLHGGATDLQAPSDETSIFENGAWHVTASGPALADAAMTYDAARDRFVLFGGISSKGVTADTVLFDGTTWTTLTVTGPSDRSGASMAYDPIRQRVVLFGGATPLGYALGDTWEWNGTTWTDRTPVPSQAPPLVNPVMYFDPLLGRVVMYAPVGGSSSRWAWDGTTGVWQDMSPPAGQASRADTAGAWLPARQTLYAFGGLSSGGDSVLDDTTEIAPLVTTTLPLTGPSARRAHAVASLPDGTGLLLHGGISPDRVSDDDWELSWRDGRPYEACVTAIDLDGDGLGGCADPDCWWACAPLCPPGAATCEPSWPHCGDGVCQGRENCRICPGDCGACTAHCGDTFCDTGEDVSCAGDCVP